MPYVPVPPPNPPRDSCQHLRVLIAKVRKQIEARKQWDMAREFVKFGKRWNYETWRIEPNLKK